MKSKNTFVTGALGAVVLIGIGVVAWSFVGTTPGATAQQVTTVTNDQNVTFSYPELTAKYTRAEAWPPQITVSVIPFICEAAVDSGEMVEQRPINGREYCVTRVVEGAAGTTYTRYVYATPLSIGSTRIITADFTLRRVQCANYDSGERSVCENEQSLFDVDALVDGIVDTI